MPCASCRRWRCATCSTRVAARSVRPFRPGRATNRRPARRSSQCPNRTRPPIAGRVRAPFALGRGVAYRIEAPGLDAVHAAIARRFAGDLTRQDSRRPHHHVTVQNKVDPETAKATLADLVASHAPYPATVTGLALWRYRGGPWESVSEFPFRGGG